MAADGNHKTGNPQINKHNHPETQPRTIVVKMLSCSIPFVFLFVGGGGKVRVGVDPGVGLAGRFRFSNMFSTNFDEFNWFSSDFV